MPTLNQISDKIYRGQLVQANLTLGAIQDEVTGAEPKCWGEITCLSQLIQALKTQVLGGDYISNATINLYDQLSSKIGFQFIDGIAFDPNAQHAPGTIFIGNQPEQMINSGIIPFTDEVSVVLATYHSVYYPLYGNTGQIQVFVSDGAGGFTPDYGNAPIIEYAIAGDELSDIESITWGFPIPTSGYISILGIQPAS